ncbi:hypothetical protein B0H12DRAFT_1238479 [Mycena haematopus]|nr:hypothetical protein B0H12DRAFT_1238479 [Mycena haematopus]
MTFIAEGKYVPAPHDAFDKTNAAPTHEVDPTWKFSFAVEVSADVALPTADRLRVALNEHSIRVMDAAATKGQESPFSAMQDLLKDLAGVWVHTTLTSKRGSLNAYDRRRPLFPNGIAIESSHRHSSPVVPRLPPLSYVPSASRRPILNRDDSEPTTPLCRPTDPFLQLNAVEPSLDKPADGSGMEIALWTASFLPVCSPQTGPHTPTAGCTHVRRS